MNAGNETEANGATAESSLGERLRERIRHAGPLTFRDWMEAALYDPIAGYYCRRDRQRWGREGDYRTSPERSSLFAATFARYFAALHESLGAPARWSIVEFGAGAGDFAAGVLSTLQTRFPAVFAATTYIIVEQSEHSIALAKERLVRFRERVQFLPPADIPIIEQGVVFSNELLDAFPVHRVIMREGQCCEFYVDVGKTGDFEWTIGPLSNARLARYLDSLGLRINEGQIVEISLGVESWLTDVASRLSNGYVVTVDYGAEAHELYDSDQRPQGTLRAFHRHQFVDDVLAHPGEHDLTTTIDWSFVKQIGERLGLETIEFERQDRFLLQAGLLEELEATVASSANEAEIAKARADCRELIMPNGMAASFQVLVQKRSSSQ